MKKKQHTSLRVSPELRDYIADLGRKGETYEEIIRRALDSYVKAMGGKLVIKLPKCGRKHRSEIK